MQRVNSKNAGKHTYCVTVIITEKTRQSVIPFILRHCDNLNKLSVLKSEIEQAEARIMPLYPPNTEISVGFQSWIELIDDIPDEESKP